MARKKILVVDDSTATMMVTKDILEGAGYEVITASDGLDAIQVALKQKPDMVLMDFVMPRMSGVAACRKLRDHPVTSETPILMVTSRMEPDSIAAGFKSGCTDYLSKPVRADELLAMVIRYLEP